MIVDQTTFRTALLDPNQPRPEGLSDGKGQSAGRRFDVYRNNVAVALIDALETAFPVVAKLVGPDNFRTLAGTFFRKHPPNSPLMMFYGDKMPEFLEQFQPTANLGYLPDIARLELAMRQSYHAADAQAIDPAVLQNTPPEKLMASRMTLAPSVRLIRSRWPIHAIWRFNTQPDAPKPSMSSDDVVVLRPDFDPEPHLLSPGGGGFIASLLGGNTMSTAVETAAGEHADFDLSAVLTLLISTGALVQLGD